MDQSSFRKPFVLALAGLAAGALIAIATQNAGPGNGQQTVTSSGTALIGGPFALTDHTGKRVTDADFKGRYMLVFFGFTHCPDICPSSLQVLSVALEKLDKTKADKVTPVFISVDPARDTPEKMASYVASFHPRLVGLTGSAEDVAAAVKTYRVYAQKVSDENASGNYSYDHSTIFYLMAPDGSFVSPIPHTTDPEEMRAALDKAIS